MSELAKRETGRALSLADYEARIYLYKEQIGTGYIGIGRTLIEAKEAGVVPHGEWEAWVTRTTGLEPRQAQRCMQAAREIKEGSALARLEMSKALMLLSSGLDEEARETVAEKAADEGATVRQLKEEIARIQQEREAENAENAETVKALKVQMVQEVGTAAEIREALKKAENDRKNLEQQLRSTISAYQARIDEEVGRAYQRGSDDGRKAKGKEAEAEIRKEFQEKLDFANAKAKAREEQLRDAEAEIRKAKAEACGKWDEGYNARGQEIAEKEEQIRKLEEKAREIEELQAELEAAEKREAKRAQELAEMKKAKAQNAMDAARGITGETLGAVDLGAAVRSFIGAAGVLPQMGNLIAGMSEKEREAIRAQVETVGRWVLDSRKALGVVTADVSIQ